MALLFSPFYPKPHPVFPEAVHLGGFSSAVMPVPQCQPWLLETRWLSPAMFEMCHKAIWFCWLSDQL